MSQIEEKYFSKGNQIEEKYFSKGNQIYLKVLLTDGKFVNLKNLDKLGRSFKIKRSIIFFVKGQPAFPEISMDGCGKKFENWHLTCFFFFFPPI
jgi:hypothetical protein